MSSHESCESEPSSVGAETYLYGDFEHFNEVYEAQKHMAYFKCVAEVDVSRSSLYLDPFYHFPELEDPHLFEALWGQDEPKYYDDAGLATYLEECEVRNVVPMRRITRSLPNDQLDLKYFALKPDATSIICEALAGNVYIETLAFEENRLSVETMTSLNGVLNKNDTILTLNLRKCYIGPAGAARIVTGLRNNRSLRELDLSYNDLGDAGVEVIAPALQFNMSIRKLDLSHNNLGDGACAALEQVLEDNYYLHDLNLSWNYFYTEQSMAALMNGMKENIAIEDLNLSWNGIGDKDTFYHIFSYLKSESSHLRALNLSNNRVTGVSVRMLKAALKVNESLSHLDLRNNPLTTDEVEMLAETFLELKETSNLQSMDFGDKMVNKSFIRTLNKIRRQGYALNYGGIYSHYKIYGPNVKEMLLQRARFLAMKPKKKKLKKDLGLFLLKLADEPMPPGDFHATLKKNKVKLDEELVEFMIKNWQDSTKNVDMKDMKEVYMKLYPDTKLPPPKPKKKKAKKKKK